jgi:hypothetical protein
MTEPGLVRKVRNFMRRPGFEKVCLLPAWLLLGASRLAILAVPFRYLAPWLGTQTGVSPWIPLLGPGNEAKASTIGRAVQLAARYTPWESNCLPQAVTARMLLGLYGIPCSVFFGVARDSGGPSMSAHAWVAAGRIPVAGGASFDRFTVVACFVATRPR